jgi:predicted DNA-binding protein
MMDYFKQFPSTTPLRAPTELDDVLEVMARRERRTKVAVLSLALEEYIERHYPDLFKNFKETTA